MFAYSEQLATGKSAKKEKKKEAKDDQDGLLDEKDEDQAIADYASAIAGAETTEKSKNQTAPAPSSEATGDADKLDLAE